MATAPEKTTTKKLKFFELRDHHQSIPRQNLLLKKLPALIYTVQVQYDDDDDDPTHSTSFCD